MDKERSGSQFLPPGFGIDNNIEDSPPLRPQPKKKKMSWIKMSIILVIVLIIIYVLYSYICKPKKAKGGSSSLSETEHEELVEKISEEELKSILNGEGHNKIEKNVSAPETLVQYSIIEKINSDLTSKLNPNIMSTLLLGKKTYEEIKNNQCELNKTSELILSHTCSILNHIFSVQITTPSDTVESGENTTSSNCLKPEEQKKEEINEETDKEEINQDNIQDRKHEVIFEKPKPKSKRGRKSAIKKNPRVEELSSDNDSVKNLTIDMNDT